MSSSATAAAWAAPDLSATERLVLLALAEGAAPDTSGIYVDLAKLASLTGVGRRTVAAAVAKLIADEHLVEVAPAARGLPAEYGITLR